MYFIFKFTLMSEKLNQFYREVKHDTTAVKFKYLHCIFLSLRYVYCQNKMLFLQSVACSKNKSLIIFPSTENHSLLKEPSVSEPMNLDDEEEKRSGDVWTDSQLTVSHLHHRESQTPGV